jgi:hypothetical protein
MLCIENQHCALRHILLNHIAAFVFSNFNLVFLYWMVDFAYCGDGNLMFVPCIYGLCIKTNSVHRVSSMYLLLMRLLYVSASTCHPQGASLSS